MRRWAGALLGIAISAALLILLAGEVDPAQLSAAVAPSDLRLLPLALVPLALDLLARTVRWRVLLAHPPRPGYRATFAYLAIGYLVNDILPGRVGELVRAHLVGSRESVGTSRALGSIALERGLDVAAASALGLVAILVAGIGGPLQAGFLVLAGASAAAVLAIALAPHRWLREQIDGAVARVALRPFAALLPRLAAFMHGLLDAASPRIVLRGLVLSFCAWGATAGVFAVAAAALDLHLSTAAVLAIAMAANLGTAIPSAPAGVGPFEFAVVWVGTALGLDPASGLLLGILSHFLTVVPVCAVGAASLIAMGSGRRSLPRPRALAGAGGGSSGQAVSSAPVDGLD